MIAYVLDTGVNTKHSDLYPRANYIPNGAYGDFVGDGHGSAEDCHGHGSHVSGTIAGTTYGVAKEATIYAGRVVNCTGGGNASMVINAMEWICRYGKQPAVVNMSLGYGDVQSVRDAATNAGVQAASSWRRPPATATSRAPRRTPASSLRPARPP